MVSFDKTFRVENNILYNFDNKTYSYISYESKLHEDLSRVLQDPEQADVIYKSYVKHLAPLITNVTDSERFSKALLMICQMFGSPEYAPLEAFKLALQEVNLTLSASNVCDFVKEVNEQLKNRIIPEKERNPNKVVIITTSASGGCEAVAKEIQAFLESRNLVGVIVDTEEIAAEHDPVKLVAGVTFDSIYHKVVQQANQMQEGFRLQAVCEQVASRYIRPRQGVIVKQIIRQQKPSLILSTCQYRSQEVAYAYSLGIPLRMIHCDYGVESPAVMDLFGKVHPQLVKWWFPSLEPYVFRSYFERMLKSELPSCDLNQKELFERLDSIAKVPLGTICAQFERFGYPVSHNIYPITDNEELTRLKEKWDISSDEKVIVIEMAKYGVGVLEDVFMKLIGSPMHNIPIKYLFVCGNNEMLRQKLTAQLKDAKNTALHRCVVYGFLPLVQMNEIRNLATLGGSKLGGATSSEYTKLRKPLLVLFTHPWEEGNAHELKRHGLLYDLGDLPLYQRVEQCIHEIISKDSPPKKVEDKTPEWQTVLLQTISRANASN